ncbi:MAG: rhomboid family GlyGly-CTERM serine protease [Alteromonadaceae bacterium]|jgi:rhomboid family GlyGly-CTERM serine protease|tara:strand:+ start:9768 stop:10364 length:597 start_codon:yes stop_codon:yes gene_type:complete
MFKIASLPFARQHTLLVVLICLISSLAFIFDKQVSWLFIYNRDLISQGEVWRIFTGHFLHTNGYHLLLNLSAILLLWALHGQFYQYVSYTFLFIITALTTSVGLYIFSTDLHQYVGLSGVLHGVFIFGALMDIKNKDKTGYLLFIGVWLKIADEQYSGASQDVAELIGANIAIDAHLWGAIGGLLFSLSYLLYQRIKT